MQTNEINAVTTAPLSDWSELVPIDAAAAELGVEPKRLRGLIARAELRDPIGDMHRVYRGSLAETRAAVLRSEGLDANA